MKDKPNIVFLFTDQQRYDTLGCTGNPVIQTKNIDKLAEKGRLYDQACTTTPLCVPARMNLITGRRIAQTHRIKNTLPPKGCPEWPTIMSILSRDGYWTQGIGKMHFFGRKYGFKDLISQEECIDYCVDDDYVMYLRSHGVRTRFPLGIRDFLMYQPQRTSIPYEHAPTTWIGDQACEFLRVHRRYRNDEVPFFLWVSWIAPHPPFAACSPYATLYDPATMSMPINMDRPEETLTTYQKKQRLRMQHAYQDPDRMRRLKSLYYGQITHVDHQVGRILDALDTYGFSDNTIIFFISDHGEMLGDQGLALKGTPFEGAIRIPFIVYWPKKAEGGERCSVPVQLTDIFPTLIDELGLSYTSKDLYGENLFGEKILEREHAVIDFGEGLERWISVRNSEYKYIRYWENQREVLYRLGKHAKEDVNLIGTGLSVEAQMRHIAQEWEEKHGVPDPPPAVLERMREELGAPLRSIVLNQGRWPKNLPPDERDSVESFAEAFNNAIKDEPTVTADKLSICQYKGLGGESLEGTLFEEAWRNA